MSLKSSLVLTSDGDCETHLKQQSHSQNYISLTRSSTFQEASLRISNGQFQVSACRGEGMPRKPVKHSCWVCLGRCFHKRLCLNQQLEYRGSSSSGLEGIMVSAESLHRSKGRGREGLLSLLELGHLSFPSLGRQGSEFLQTLTVTFIHQLPWMSGFWTQTEL